MAKKTQDGESRLFLFLESVVVMSLLAFSLASCNVPTDSFPEASSPEAPVSARSQVELAELEVQPEPSAPILSRNGYAGKAIVCPFPQHTSYVVNAILPDHRTREQLDTDTVRAYEDWKSAYLVEVPVESGASLYRVAFSAAQPDRTVSEGIGYGMMIAVSMAGHDPAARQYFDGLWRFARQHPSSIDSRLTAWQVPENPAGDANAFDGDADMALALLMADKQWGSDGAVDYGNEAVRVITALRESAIGPDSALPMLGDWVDPEGERHNQFTPRSSDFMLANFRAFSNVDAHWLPVIDASLSVIQEMQRDYSAETGLLPDFIEHDSLLKRFRPAQPGFLEGAHDGQYYYNAGRVPLRVAVDVLTSGDPTSLAIAGRLAKFAVKAIGDDPAAMGAGFALDGSAIGNYFTSFFASPLAVALMTQPQYQQQLNTLYDAIYQRREGYYEDSITLLSLLVLSGNFWSIDQNCG